MTTQQIELLKKVDVSQPNPAKTYKQMVVTLRDLKDNKPDGKKIFDFTTPPEVWDTLVAAEAGTFFDIAREKNEKGYWEWKGITKSNGVATAPAEAAQQQVAARPGTTQARVGNWETTEERAARQVMIVRQSSLATAKDMLIARGVINGITSPNVIGLAKELEAYVLGTGSDEPE